MELIGALTKINQIPVVVKKHTLPSDYDPVTWKFVDQLKSQ